MPRSHLSNALSILWGAAILGAPLTAAAQQDTLRAKPRPDTAGLVTSRDSARAAADSAGRRRAEARRLALLRAPEAKPPISPRRAFLYSLAIPGLGQSRLDRPNAGALFATIEILSIAMAGKSAWDLRYARHHAADSIAATWQTDATGRIVFDSAGPVVATWVRNYYAGATVSARRTHYEDWISALIFNHLFAGADAFVAAQLWDVPTRVSLQAAPRRLTIGVSAPF